MAGEVPDDWQGHQGVIPGLLLTRRFTEALADDIGGYADRTSVLEASRRYNVNYKTTLAFEKAYLSRKQKYAPAVNPTRIGVDEIRLGKMGWRVVVSDLDAGRPIWIGGKDRSQESFEAFFLWLGEDKYKLITLCVMDMWRPYRAELRKFCPTADVVFDKFHVVAKMSEAMDAVRRSEYARLNGEQRKFSRDSAQPARQPGAARTGREELAQTFKANRRLYTAYLLKEDFDRLWSYKSEAWMCKFWLRGKKGSNGSDSSHFRRSSEWWKATGKESCPGAKLRTESARIRRRAEQPDTQDPGPRLRLHGHRAHGSQDTDLHAPRRSAFDS